MAKTLNDKDIQKILGIIDGWKGKLTYEKLIDAAEMPLRHRYSRQALYGHVRIREAVNNRKNALRNGTAGKQVKSVELQKALERIERLNSVIQRLEKENEVLLSQFVRWAYNAHSKGLTPEFLNAAMPEIDRGATKSKEGKEKNTEEKKPA